MNTYEKEYIAIKEKTALIKLLTGNKNAELKSLGTLSYDIKCKPKNKLKKKPNYGWKEIKNCRVIRIDRL
jgi:hypothetical protein